MQLAGRHLMLLNVLWVGVLQVRQAHQRVCDLGEVRQCRGEEFVAEFNINAFTRVLSRLAYLLEDVFT